MLHRARVLNNVVITTVIEMVEMVEILDGRVGKRSVERVRCLSWSKMRRWDYVPKHAHAQSQFGAVKTDLGHPCYSFNIWFT